MVVRRYAVIVCALAVLFCIGPANVSQAEGLIVGAGSTVRLGDGRLDLGCGDLEIDPGASLFGDQGAIDLSGSWVGGGTFIPGSSAVRIVDACFPQASIISGSNQFFVFTAMTSGGKQIRFEANSTQTIDNSLELMGASGGPLLIRSTVTGTAAFLDLAQTGSQLIDWVDVRDNHATGQPLAPGPPPQFNSIDSGNTIGWFLFGVEIPTLSAVGVTTLAMVMLMLGLAVIRRASGSA